MKREYLLSKIMRKKLSKKQSNRLLHTCRQNAIKHFIKIFDKEPFAEFWSYSHKSKVIIEARVPNLLKNKVHELISQLQTEKPDGYAIILSFKNNTSEGIENHEKFTHRYTGTHTNYAFIAVERDTVEDLYVDSILNLLPPKESRSILWDAHEVENLKNLAHKLQFLPRKVWQKTIDQARKSSSRKNIDNHIIPTFISLSDDTGHEVKVDPRIESSEVPDIDDICYYAEIRRYFSHLTKRQKEVLELRYIEDLNTTQTAGKLGIKKQTVSEIESSAKKKLKHLLKSEKPIIYTLDSLK